jgi:cullin-4
MSKVAGKGPAFVDLTRLSNFQPQAGAKKIVIKNLRTSNRADLAVYYDKIWLELDNALSSVFKEEEPAVPLETLCRGVDATCRYGRSEQLFNLLRDRCKGYLQKSMLPIIEAEGDGPNESMLRTVWKYWSVWNLQSVIYNPPDIKSFAARLILSRH